MKRMSFVARILDSCPDPGVEHEMFAGTVGTGAATEFSGFLRMFRELPNIETILPRLEETKLAPIPPQAFDGAALSQDSLDGKSRLRRRSMRTLRFPE